MGSIRFSLPSDLVWHAFKSFDACVGAGSECLDDALMAWRLAKVLERSGVVCPSSLNWLEMTEGEVRETYKEPEE